MNCPYQESLMPRCQIVTHPDRANVEYCRVCGEWRYLDSIGNDHANFFSFLLAMAIIGLVLGSILQSPSQSGEWQQPTRSREVNQVIRRSG